jgi:hypothetical protein
VTVPSPTASRTPGPRRTFRNGSRPSSPPSSRMGPLFSSIAYARVILAEWCADYNANRPNSRLGWMTPLAYAATLVLATGRAAAQRGSFAPRPVAHPAQTGSTQSRILPIAGSTVVDAGGPGWATELAIVCGIAEGEGEGRTWHPAPSGKNVRKVEVSRKAHSYVGRHFFS